MKYPNLRRDNPTSTGRSKVVRDTLVFQLKLACDGIRDVFLSPISLAAALAGIVFYPSKPDHYLRKLMLFGHKTDRWLNLFGAYSKRRSIGQKTSDTYVDKVEEILVKDFQEGGLVKVVKDGTGKIVEKAQQEVTVVKTAFSKKNEP